MYQDRSLMMNFVHHYIEKHLIYSIDMNQLIRTVDLFHNLDRNIRIANPIYLMANQN